MGVHKILHTDKYVLAISLRIGYLRCVNNVIIKGNVL